MAKDAVGNDGSQPLTQDQILKDLVAKESHLRTLEEIEKQQQGDRSSRRKMTKKAVKVAF